MDKYYKLLNRDLTHHGMVYHTGLNVDPVPFNDNPRNHIGPGGLYFTEMKGIQPILRPTHGWLAEVEIPDGETAIGCNTAFGYAGRAHSLAITKLYDLSKADTWKFIRENTAIAFGSDILIRWLSVNGPDGPRFEVIEYLMGICTVPGDLLGGRICELAAEDGNLNLVRFMMEKKYAHPEKNYALLYAVLNSKNETAKYLVEHGADIHACGEYALRTAVEHGDVEMVRYLVGHGADPWSGNVCTPTVAETVYKLAYGELKSISEDTYNEIIKCFNSAGHDGDGRDGALK